MSVQQVPRFPLGNLSSDIHRRIFENMRGNSLIALSAVSPKWFKSIKNAKLSLDIFQVSIEGRMLRADIWRWKWNDLAQVELELKEDEEPNNHLNLETVIPSVVKLVDHSEDNEEEEVEEEEQEDDDEDEQEQEDELEEGEGEESENENDNENEMEDEEDEEQEEEEGAGEEGENVNENQDEIDDDDEEEESVEEENIIAMWSNKNGGMRNWINYLMDLFNVNRIGILFVNQNIFLSDSVRNTLAGIKVDSMIFGQISHNTARRVFYAMPRVEGVTFLHIPFRKDDNSVDALETTRALSGNFQSIQLHNDYSGLDSLLCTNASFIRIDYNGFTSKDMNRFLKSWIKGSNRRLEFLELNIRDQETRNGIQRLEEGVLFNGIERQELQMNVVKTIEVPHDEAGLIKTRKIEGGFLIRNRYTSATITLKRYDNFDYTRVFFYCHPY